MRTALVTGGSTGIGKSICNHLLEDGYTVVNLSRRPCPEAHERLHNYSVDLADRDATAEVAAQIAGSVGLAGSANLGREAAMFEAVHGSAPDIAGKGLANPLALLMSGVMMLNHLADTRGDEACREGPWSSQAIAGLPVVISVCGCRRLPPPRR